MRSNGFNIYVMKCERFYKIGLSRSIPKRIKTLQGGLPFKIELIEIYKVENKDERRYLNKTEKFIHKHFHAKRVNGEWFELTESDLKEIPSLIKKSFLTSPEKVIPKTIKV